MRAIVCEQLGDPTLPLGSGVLRLKEDQPAPQIKPGCIRVRVTAASLNFPDALQVKVRKGRLYNLARQYCCCMKQQQGMGTRACVHCHLSGSEPLATVRLYVPLHLSLCLFVPAVRVSDNGQCHLRVALFCSSCCTHRCRGGITMVAPSVIWSISHESVYLHV
jgi:hypothetical protein